MTNSSTTNSSPNSSYIPSSPFGLADIQNSDTSPDTQSSGRSVPTSRESSSDAVLSGSHHPRAVPPADCQYPRTEPNAQHPMAEERKGKDVSRNTSPSTSSQGDMADTEADAGPSTEPAEESTVAPPPKKKRTRTLTTPHQAAVLHALLAQSRFPTTAMREEVGRAIGLSARKVQIWFQNQRQKARRPRGQNVPPLSRPPQYGPFQNIPSGSSLPEAGSSSRAGAVAEALQAHPALGAGAGAGAEAFGYRDSFSSEGPSQLSGPGMPGSIPSSPPSPRAIRSAPYPRPDTRGVFGPRSPRASFAMRPLSAEARPRPLPPRARATSPQPRQSIDSALAALTLPPLIFDRPRSYTVSGASAPSSFFPLTPPLVPPPAPQPGMDAPGHARPRPASLGTDSPFAYEAPLRIPPPFTLQPRPQWDDASFSPFHRRPTRTVPNRIPHEPFTLPQYPSGLSQEGTALPLPPPPLLTPLVPIPSIPSEAAVTSHPSITPETSGTMPARRRRYDEDDAKSHDQDAAP